MARKRSVFIGFLCNIAIELFSQVCEILEFTVRGRNCWRTEVVRVPFTKTHTRAKFQRYIFLTGRIGNVRVCVCVCLANIPLENTGH